MEEDILKQNALSTLYPEHKFYTCITHVVWCVCEYKNITPPS